MTMTSEFQSTKMPLGADTQAAFVRWAYGLFGYQPCDDDLGRDVFIVPFDGSYGRAGYIATVEGSPVRVALMILTDPECPELIGLSAGRTVRGGKEKHGIQGRRYREAIDWLERFGFSTG